jgi:hypothetical protein
LIEVDLDQLVFWVSMDTRVFQDVNGFFYLNLNLTRGFRRFQKFEFLTVFRNTCLQTLTFRDFQIENQKTIKKGSPADNFVYFTRIFIHAFLHIVPESASCRESKILRFLAILSMLK